MNVFDPENPDWADDPLHADEAEQPDHDDGLVTDDDLLASIKILTEQLMRSTAERDDLEQALIEAGADLEQAERHYVEQLTIQVRRAEHAERLLEQIQRELAVTSTSRPSRPQYVGETDDDYSLSPEIAARPWRRG